MPRLRSAFFRRAMRRRLRSSSRSCFIADGVSATVDAPASLQKAASDAACAAGSNEAGECIPRARPGEAALESDREDVRSRSDQPRSPPPPALAGELFGSMRMLAARIGRWNRGSGPRAQRAERMSGSVCCISRLSAQVAGRGDDHDRQLSQSFAWARCWLVAVPRQGLSLV